MAWTPNRNPRRKTFQEVMEVIYGIIGFAVFIIGGLVIVGAYRQGKFDSYIEAFRSGMDNATSARSTPESSVRASGLSCAERDGSQTVYFVDSANRTVTVDLYNASGRKFCRTVFRDGITGPITSNQLCQPANGAEVLLATMLSGMSVRQTVSIRGSVVSYGGLIVGGMLQGQRQDATFNLSTGEMIDPNGNRMVCDLAR